MEETGSEGAYVAALVVSLLSFASTMGLLAVFLFTKGIRHMVQVWPVMWMIVTDAMWSAGQLVQYGAFVLSGFEHTLNGYSHEACVGVALFASQFFPVCSFGWWVYISLNILKVLRKNGASIWLEDVQQSNRLAHLTIWPLSVLLALGPLLANEYGPIDDGVECYIDHPIRRDSLYWLFKYVPLLLATAVGAAVLFRLGSLWCCGSRRQKREFKSRFRSYRYHTRFEFDRTDKNSANNTGLVLFVLVFWATWAVPIVSRCYAYSTGQYINRSMEDLHIALRGSAGLLNFFVWASSPVFVTSITRCDCCSRRCNRAAFDMEFGCADSSSYTPTAAISAPAAHTCDNEALVPLFDSGDVEQDHTHCLRSVAKNLSAEFDAHGERGER